MHWSLVPHDPCPLQEFGQYAEAVLTRARTRTEENFDIIIVLVAGRFFELSYPRNPRLFNCQLL